MQKIIVIVVLSALILGGCGPRGVPVGELLPTPAAPSETAWNLEFSYTGGFAGFNRKMEVDSAGQATVTDIRTGETAQVQLSREQLTELRELAAQAVFQPGAKPGPCADCFVYTLKIEPGTGTPFTAQVDDTNLEASGLSALINYLREVMDNALK